MTWVKQKWTYQMQMLYTILPQIRENDLDAYFSSNTNNTDVRLYKPGSIHLYGVHILSFLKHIGLKTKSRWGGNFNYSQFIKILTTRVKHKKENTYNRGLMYCYHLCNPFFRFHHYNQLTQNTLNNQKHPTAKHQPGAIPGTLIPMDMI